MEVARLDAIWTKRMRFLSHVGIPTWGQVPLSKVRMRENCVQVKIQYASLKFSTRPCLTFINVMSRVK